MAKELSAKWKKYIAAYDGDVKAACAIAGISYSYARRVIVTDKRIMDAISSRRVTEEKHISTERQEKHAPLIATRQDRQSFWTDVMQDKEENMRDRLRAAELLGKSEADFTENIKHAGGITVTRTRKRYDGSDS